MWAHEKRAWPRIWDPGSSVGIDGGAKCGGGGMDLLPLVGRGRRHFSCGERSIASTERVGGQAAILRRARLGGLGSASKTKNVEM